MTCYCNQFGEELRRFRIIAYANDGYATARFGAFYHALDNLSRRCDLVSDQADRLDGAQTEQESRVLDLEATVEVLEMRLRDAEDLILFLVQCAL
ncbi:MAG: hypothetical protein IPO81_09495 [Kouleothrix sp.]|nr:hypothetical protein [Kouleothrix sp.]